MKPSSAKAKGRSFQQSIMKLMLDKAPSLEADDITSRSMGANGEDLLMSPAARKIYPISVECKNLASMAFYKWVDQAKENCPRGIQPVVFAKANRKKAVAIVDAEYFIELLGDKK